MFYGLWSEFLDAWLAGFVKDEALAVTRRAREALTFRRRPGPLHAMGMVFLPRHLPRRKEHST